MSTPSSTSSSSLITEYEAEALLDKLVNNLFVKGKLGKFVKGWVRTLRRYEAIQKPIPDELKKFLLQNNIPPKIWRDIKVFEENDIAAGKPPMTYDKFLDVIFRLALKHDKRHSNMGDEELEKEDQRLNETEAQHVNNNDVAYSYASDDDIESLHDDHVLYMIPKSEIFDYYGPVHEYTNPSSGAKSFFRRPALKKEVFDSLSSDDKKAWDALSDVGKMTVITGEGVTLADVYGEFAEKWGDRKSVV